MRRDGSFFGTLCAIDPEPRGAPLLGVREKIEALAARVVQVLDGETAPGR